MKKALIILILLIPIAVTAQDIGYAQIDYAELIQEVNRIRRSAAVPTIEVNYMLTDLARIQVEAMIRKGIFAHKVGDRSVVSQIEKKISRQYGHYKSYFTVQIYELISRAPIIHGINPEIYIAHIYDLSPRHYTALTSPNAEIMGWYVAESDGYYWVSTYVLVRYYE